jgi:hypothetical protein
MTYSRMLIEIECKKLSTDNQMDNFSISNGERNLV